MSIEARYIICMETKTPAQIADATVHELLQMQTLIANELRSRKAKLQKDLAALASVRASRQPRSDIGKPRKKVALLELAPSIEAELDAEAGK